MYILHKAGMSSVRRVPEPKKYFDTKLIGYFASEKSKEVTWNYKIFYSSA